MELVEWDPRVEPAERVSSAAASYFNWTFVFSFPLSTFPLLPVVPTCLSVTLTTTAHYTHTKDTHITTIQPQPCLESLRLLAFAFYSFDHYLLFNGQLHSGLNHVPSSPTLEATSRNFKPSEPSILPSRYTSANTVYLSKAFVFSYGYHLFIPLLPGWVMVIHFALHGRIHPFCPDELNYTEMCHYLNLPPTTPMILRSTSTPEGNSIVCVDRNKLMTIGFYPTQVPFNMFRFPKRGPCPWNDTVLFEQRISTLGVNGELVRNTIPIYEFICDR